MIFFFIIGENHHFHVITSMSALIRHQLPKSNNTAYFCNNCNIPTFRKSTHEKHIATCSGEENSHLPDPEFAKLKFKSFEKELPVPYIFTADIETLQKRNDICSNQWDHTATAIGLKVSNLNNVKDSKYFEYFGKNCIQNFFVCVQREALNVYENCLSSKVAKPIIFTKEDKKKFDKQKSCRICLQDYSLSNNIIKVRHHLHTTGIFISSLCSECNLKIQIREPFIPLWIHNGSKFDFHFLCRHFPKGSTIKVLAKSRETYLSITWKIPLAKSEHQFLNVIFLDSFRFLPSSLEKLVQILPNELLFETKQEVGDSKETNEFFRKNVYPYDYLDTWEKYDLPLPSKDDFFSKLTGKGITNADYEFAVKAYTFFKCKNLKDYTLIYLKFDVCLLADVVINMIRQGISNYNLDPCHYLSAPHYAFDCALKLSKVEIDLFKKGEEDKYEFINNSIRGGISTLGSTRHIKSNNKYMGDKFDPKEIEKYIFYCDKNSLYGSIMLNEMLPISNYEWESIDKLKNHNYFLNHPKNASYSYFLEVDIKYDKKLHDLHKELPFLAENISPPGNKQTKLILNLYHKKKYVLHLSHLQLCIKHGLKIEKIHRALRFNQNNWLRTYIEFNLNKRINSTNSFDKMYYKLQVNSIFGKTLQNNESFIDIKFITQWDYTFDKNKKRLNAQSLIASPRFKSISIFSENLVAIQLTPTKICLNRPKIVGSTILELSKIEMYSFFYDVLLKHYEKNPNNVKLTLTDTDSFLFSIENDHDPFKNFVLKNVEHFDTAAFDRNIFPFMPLVNKDVPGKMKIEFNGQIIDEVIALRPKLYSFILDNKDEHTRAKGINYNAKRTLSHADYLHCYKTNEKKNVTIHEILSKLHNVITKCCEKTALSTADDKRCYLSNNKSLPYGHYAIVKQYNRIENSINTVKN